MWNLKWLPVLGVILSSVAHAQPSEINVWAHAAVAPVCTEFIGSVHHWGRRKIYAPRASPELAAFDGDRGGFAAADA